jgi:protein gp37
VVTEIANLKEGRPLKTTPSGVVKTQASVAQQLGVSPRTAQRAAHIKKHGTKELFEDVKAGKVKPKEAEEILKQQRNTSPVFNFTNDNIEWAKWSWNPMTGCKHGCAYCYARDIAMRFDGTFEPKFRKERLLAPSNTKIPPNLINSPGINTVFVCSMADLFGDWVDQKHIQQILDVCEKTPQWTYILLTKNPKRYAQFKFPANCWAGATVDTQARVDSTYEGLLECDAPIRFVSCEPLKGPIGFPENMPINWLIIGGQSKSVGEPAFQPEWQWVEDLMIQAWRLEIPVYWKPNLTVRPKEYPNV